MSSLRVVWSPSIFQTLKVVGKVKEETSAVLADIVLSRGYGKAVGQQLAYLSRHIDHRAFCRE